MKYLLVAALVAVAAARPQEQKTLADFGILRMSSSSNDDGSFQYSYETADPSSQDVSGQQKQIGDKQGGVQQGTYSFTAKDESGNDVQVTINWVADENGFQPTGDVLPVAPADTNAAAQAEAYAKFSNL